MSVHGRYPLPSIDVFDVYIATRKDEFLISKYHLFYVWSLFQDPDFSPRLDPLGCRSQLDILGPTDIVLWCFMVWHDEGLGSRNGVSDVSPVSPFQAFPLSPLSLEDSGISDVSTEWISTARRAAWTVLASTDSPAVAAMDCKQRVAIIAGLRPSIGYHINHIKS